jgi:hypothetical protein
MISTFVRSAPLPSAALVVHEPLPEPGAVRVEADDPAGVRLQLLDILAGSSLRGQREAIYRALLQIPAETLQEMSHVDIARAVSLEVKRELDEQSLRTQEAREAFREEIHASRERMAARTGHVGPLRRDPARTLETWRDVYQGDDPVDTLLRKRADDEEQYVEDAVEQLDERELLLRSSQNPVIAMELSGSSRQEAHRAARGDERTRRGVRQVRAEAASALHSPSKRRESSAAPSEASAKSSLEALLLQRMRARDSGGPRTVGGIDTLPRAYVTERNLGALIANMRSPRARASQRRQDRISTTKSSPTSSRTPRAPTELTVPTNVRRLASEVEALESMYAAAVGSDNATK